MNRTILASSLRGTVASSKMVVGATRARAANAVRLALAKRIASSEVWATCTDLAPFPCANRSIA
jgi:hypothetical protein